MDRQALLEGVDLRSRLSRAAILAWLGDLDEAERFMRAVRTTVRRDDHAGVLSWPSEHGLPGGGIVAGSEPVTNIAVLLLAVVGPWWPQVDEARRVFEETIRAWQVISKRRRNGQ